jgi:O-antigen ligase
MAFSSYIFFFEKSLFTKPVRFLLMFILCICISLTYSRGTFLAFFIVVLCMVFKKRMVIGAGLLLPILIAIYILLPRPYGESVNLLRTFSINSRIQNYKEGVTIWAHNPVIGVGYNRIRYERNKSDFTDNIDLSNNHAGASFHSSFLIILATGGVIGLVLYIMFLISVSKRGNMALWSTVFLSLLSLTDNVLLHPFVLVIYFIIISAILSQDHFS